MAETGFRAAAALNDDLRRGMYSFIRAARRPVSRTEAAAAVGISQKLAAFHLDKLVTAGLLKARYEPVGGIRKVGRTPKVYEPTDTEIQVTIPERQHDVLAEILLDAVLDETENEPARRAVMRVAHQRGEDLGATERDQLRRGRLGAERALTIAGSVLARHGFEPTRENPTCIRLRNCPFHPLAARSPDLVCGINHAFLTGILTGLRTDSVQAELQPSPGHCCVVLEAGLG